MNNGVNLPEAYRANNRSWSNHRGYGYMQFFNDKSFNLAPFHRIRPLNAPYETNVNTDMAWANNTTPQMKQIMNETCNLTYRPDFSPRVPMRANDFDLAGFKCLG